MQPWNDPIHYGPPIRLTSPDTPGMSFNVQPCHRCGALVTSNNYLGSRGLTGTAYHSEMHALLDYLTAKK